jgi:hypothetical protein
MALIWGTTRANLRGYRGRVHIVRSGQHGLAWCGLGVDRVWPERPPPAHSELPVICPECAIACLAATHPINARKHP